MARAADGPKCGQCARSIALDQPLHLTDADFERVVRDAEVPVVVDFYADWCGPCKAMAPVLDQLARDRAGQILVAKVDTDRNPGISAHLAIRSIPTLIAFNGGKGVARVSGAVGGPRLDAMVRAALGS